jgi:hypothetical protein
LVNVIVTLLPPPTLVAFTARDGGKPTTVTGTLVAAREYPLFGKRRNSYVPEVVGIVTVHERVVTPLPTYVYCR